MERLIRLPEILQITGLARSTIYKKLSEGRFPRPVNLGGRAVAWLSSDIENWINERVAERDRQAAKEGAG